MSAWASHSKTRCGGPPLSCVRCIMAQAPILASDMPLTSQPQVMARGAENAGDYALQVRARCWIRSCNQSDGVASLDSQPRAIPRSGCHLHLVAPKP